MARYEFELTLTGVGNTPEEAWEDAVGAFSDDPGIPQSDGVMVSTDDDGYEEVEKLGRWTGSNPNPYHPINYWTYAVDNGDTELGYHDWVNSLIEMAAGFVMPQPQQPELFCKPCRFFTDVGQDLFFCEKYKTYHTKNEKVLSCEGKLPIEDGPGFEDGPWAEGWEHRSVTRSMGFEGIEDYRLKRSPNVNVEEGTVLEDFPFNLGTGDSDEQTT